jgi:hypothetical protein
MTWLASAVTPVGAATGDIVTYILGYGVLGIVALAFAFRYIVPRSAISDGRQDLLREIEQLRQEKEHAEQQRDEAMRIAQTQIVPLLTTSTASFQSLIPLLQDLVRTREGGSHDRTGPGS